MIFVEDRGSTRSGRTYLLEYLKHVPTQRREEIIENLLKSKRVDIDNLSNIMEIMSIHRTTVTIPEKSLKECSAPTLHYLKEPIFHLGFKPSFTSCPLNVWWTGVMGQLFICELSSSRHDDLRVE